MSVYAFAKEPELKAGAIGRVRPVVKCLSAGSMSNISSSYLAAGFGYALGLESSVSVYAEQSS